MTNKLFKFDWKLAAMPISYGIMMIILGTMILFGFNHPGLTSVDESDVILFLMMSCFWVLYATDNK